MESLMKLTDDIFNQEILQYLTLDNIVNLDWSSNGMNIDGGMDGWIDTEICYVKKLLVR